MVRFIKQTHWQRLFPFEFLCVLFVFAEYETLFAEGNKKKGSISKRNKGSEAGATIYKWRKTSLYRLRSDRTNSSGFGISVLLKM